jgi:hypothetical protein
MYKEFTPYEQALELKELGFKKDNDFGLLYKGEDIPAILYQQAFRWFRDKYDLFISIMHYENGYSINDLRRFDTYEEAELACLKKLIEIVKKDL